MRLSDTMARALSDQVTLELTASIVYLQLAIELDNQDLTGMSSWMRAQAEEEQVHAAKFISHSLDRGSAPQIGTIEAPSFSGRTPVQLFEAALATRRRSPRRSVSSTAPPRPRATSTSCRCSTGSSTSSSRRRRASARSSGASPSSATTAPDCSAWTASSAAAPRTSTAASDRTHEGPDRMIGAFVVSAD